MTSGFCRNTASASMRMTCSKEEARAANALIAHPPLASWRVSSSSTVVMSTVSICDPSCMTTSLWSAGRSSSPAYMIWMGSSDLSTSRKLLIRWHANRKVPFPVGITIPFEPGTKRWRRSWSGFQSGGSAGLCRKGKVASAAPSIASDKLHLWGIVI